MEIDLTRMSEPQRDFFLSDAKYTCYGGARGGGKSWGMRTLLVLNALKYPGLNILLLRRTLPELRENHIVPMRAMLHGVAKYNATEKTFTFPNGSRIVAGYLAHEGDILQYQGQEYGIIGMEEATHFTEDQMQLLIPCNRDTRSGRKPRMYFTCNPGGVGHSWVKRLFVDGQYEGKENPANYKFIRARVYDNAPLMEANPEYVDALEGLPEDLRRAYLDGDWDVFVGQYFTEFRRELHVCEPFEIPAHWSRFRALDYGLDMLAVVWGAFDELGNAYIYRELCKPDVVIADAARMILDASANEPVLNTFAPADMWARNRATGRGQAEMFAEAGLILTQVRNSRIDGWLSLKDWMRPIDNGTGEKRPRLQIFSTCRKLIHDLPLLQHDEHNPTDVSTQPHDITHTCFTGDTRVLMADGSEKEIRDIVAGDRVTSYDGGQIEGICVASGLVAKKADVICITLDDGRRVRSTPDHKFLTPRGWMRADELREGDELIDIGAKANI